MYQEATIRPECGRNKVAANPDEIVLYGIGTPQRLLTEGLLYRVVVAHCRRLYAALYYALSI